MPKTWKEHCPYYDPARRQAWGEGWKHRKKHGYGGVPGRDAENSDIGHEDINDPEFLLMWLKGYSAANDHLQEAEQGDRQ